MKKLLLTCAYCCFLFPLMAHAIDTPQKNSNFQTTEEILALSHDEKPTNCASEIMSDMLYAHANEVSDTDDEMKVRAWAYQTILTPEVIKQILECPEIEQITDDEKTIHFTPIVFHFSEAENARTLTIKFSTQKKVLKQHLILSTKRSLPNGDPNPKLMDPNDPAIYINTDPAWYAIMVVQHDALKDFVGPDKNNTLSMKYLDENINKIYPHGYFCTSKSAWANDSDTINNVVHELVDIEDDSNDYYVAGDVNLEWVMYAEIALEVILTVVTFGGGEVAMIGLKTARATKSAKTLIKSIKELSKLEDVKKYIDVSRKIAKHTDDIGKLEKNIANAKKYEKALKNADKARQAGKDATKYEKQAQEILESAKKIDPNITEDTLKNADSLKSQKKSLEEGAKTLEKDAEKMVKDSENVKNFKESSDVLTDVMKYRRDLRAFRRPQTGNVITKNFKRIKNIGKTVKAANKGAKILNKAGRVGRKGMSSFSAKAKDFLFDQTLKHGARIARFERDVGFVYGALAFLGDMYDQTSNTNSEYSNGIEMKPLCLLSADDLEGQENVVNYGMWLLWEGNSTDAADDDAAYLQAMDFAEKFAHELEVYQDELPAIKTAKMGGASAVDLLVPKPFPRSAFLCNVDIFVVRPIIRLDESDPDETKGELFYLIMNDIPWTTADQFGEMVPDVEEWERSQQQYASEDPAGKNPQPENAESSVETPSDDNSSEETQTTSYSENTSIDAVAFVPTSQPSQSTSDPDTYCKRYINNSASIFQTSSQCNKLSGNDVSRCKKCVSHAGTYENGRCYIEILHWVCRDKGWSSTSGRTCAANSQYSKCGLIRKYVDAEKPFTCPSDGAISGCCQHGNSSGAKHPPVNLSGSKFIDMDCKLPLSSNLNWRIAHNNGSAVGLNGKNSRDWCMPNASSHPWNDANQPGGDKHCAKSISGGTSLQYWHSLN